MNHLYGISNIYNGRILSRKVREGRYDYGYDGYGRLTEAAFSGNDLADYSTEYSYDANANITGLIRKGVVDRAGKSKIYGILDATGVTLEGNRAVGYDIEYDGDVFEGRTGFGSLSGYCEVQYDDNGNVAYDETTMTAYFYNRHNKPVLIEADDGSSLSFEYDGTGTLISKTQTSGGITTKTEYICPYELVDGEFKAAYFDGTIYDSEMDAVTFVIPGGAFGPLGLIAHEFKHGYQFLTGEIDLAIDGMEPRGSLFYDLFDEIEAYERGTLFNADKFSISEIAEHYSYLSDSKKSVYSLLNSKSDWRILPWADKVQGLKNWATKANSAYGHTYIRKGAHLRKNIDARP